MGRGLQVASSHALHNHLAPRSEISCQVAPQDQDSSLCIPITSSFARRFPLGAHKDSGTPQ